MSSYFLSKSYYFGDINLLLFKNINIHKEIINTSDELCKNNCLYLTDDLFISKTMFKYKFKNSIFECVDEDYLSLCKNEVLYSKHKNMVIVVRNESSLSKEVMTMNDFNLYEKKCDKNILGEETAECYRIYVRHIKN